MIKAASPAMRTNDFAAWDMRKFALEVQYAGRAELPMEIPA